MNSLIAALIIGILIGGFICVIIPKINEKDKEKRDNIDITKGSISDRRLGLKCIEIRDHINSRDKSVFDLTDQDIERIKNGKVAYWIDNDIRDLCSSTKDLRKGNILDVKAMLRKTNEHIDQSYEDNEDCVRHQKSVKFASVSKSILDKIMDLLITHQHLDLDMGSLKNITIPDFVSLFANSDKDNGFPNNEWLTQLYTYSSYIRIKWESIDPTIRTLISHDPENTMFCRYISLATLIDNLFLSGIFDVDVINKDVKKRRGNYINDEYPPS